MSTLGVRNMSFVGEEQSTDLLFKKPARASTVETPRMLRVPSPSPLLLSHEALITIASLPECLGDARTAYAFVPFMVCRENENIHKGRRSVPTEMLVENEYLWVEDEIPSFANSSRNQSARLLRVQLC